MCEQEGRERKGKSNGKEIDDIATARRSEENSRENSERYSFDRELERDTHIDVQLGMVSIRVWLTRGMLRGDVREKRKERNGN